ncbi:MAG: GAF domain-containing sensor histidine kinase [Candidatus Riflebacteria bacterium]|nr:GAF domain-containing sensor histidine kinase [Candidatus Riflebacteria bacterium]
MDQFYRNLLTITTEISRGATLEQVFDRFYDDFKVHVPYDRIGVTTISDDQTMVRSIWARAEYQPLLLGLGYQSQLAGSTLQKIIETGEPRILNDLEAYLKEKPDSHSTNIVLKEGVRSSLTCPLIADGKPIGFLFFSKTQPRAYENAHVERFKEIAEHLSLAVDKMQTLERLRKLNDTKNKFLGIAAHDLRSPLAAVQSYSEMLEEPGICDDADRKTFILGRIKTITKRMFNLINDLLDISAIESGQLKLDLQLTELIPFLNEALENHELTAKMKEITILGEIPATLPAIEIDAKRIAQVIDNLISNAVKFSPKGTTVTLRSSEESGKIKISVSDHGQGIPEEEQKKLFQEFGKTSVKPTDGEKSTGLGLAIVKKIITGHGGQVGVKSKVGEGSTFYFTLPVKA